MILTNSTLVCQVRALDNFYGESQKGGDICVRNGNYANDESVERLIGQIVDRFGVKNAFLTMACDRTSNAQATVDEKGRPYILYNPEFLKSVKTLDFTRTSLGTNKVDWETLTILAHEVGHHLNYHLINPHPSATRPGMELEADETAGFILYKLGATLEESQRAMRSGVVSIEGSYTHPPRAQRLEAIRKGWEKARILNPGNIPAPAPTTNKVFDIDGTEYEVTKIGDMSWTKRNLDVSRFRNGDLIPQAQSAEAWKRAKENQQPAWCYFDNNPENGKIYGKLYNWYAVNDRRGICPQGWHVPSDTEWTKLTNDLGGEEMAGGKMKSKGSTYWDSPNVGATNESGFTGLPGGYRFSDGSFYYVRNYAIVWSASEYFSYAWNRILTTNFGNVYRNNDNDKSVGASVRCLRD